MMNLRTVCVALALCMGLAVAASAGERGISKSTLGSMGLGAMQSISDNDGLAVRGKGTSVAIWGTASSNAGFGNHGATAYTASASHFIGPASISGGASTISFNGLHVAGSIGSSFAVAH